jgi:hypothetical protein
MQQQLQRETVNQNDKHGIENFVFHFSIVFYEIKNLGLPLIFAFLFLFIFY